MLISYILIKVLIVLINLIPIFNSNEVPFKILEVYKYWKNGICGQNVKIGVFDTGLNLDNEHFKYSKIFHLSDLTTEDKTSSHNIDGNGHGSSVAATIAGAPYQIYHEYFSKNLFRPPESNDCPVLGIAPLSSLYIYKVFTDNQISATNWFIQAFNEAIREELHVINLSIGGPDYLDYPFIEKIREITGHGILLVSAIGNDGPTLGSLNNPGDQIEVLSVGGLDMSKKKLASYSSRGMTLWELSSGGYGRVKPDIITLSEDILSVKIDNDLSILSKLDYFMKMKNPDKCQVFSGTSAASPIVTGAVSLVINVLLRARNMLQIQEKKSIPESELPPLNPASIRQILMKSSDKLSQFSMFEQGSGILNISRALKVARTFKSQATLFPSYIDFTECPYMWPYCYQPMYALAEPVIVNVTILNSMSVSGRINDLPIYHPITSRNGHCLLVMVEHSPIIYPYAGWIALSLQVNTDFSECTTQEITAEGYLSLVVSSDHASVESKQSISHIKMPIRVSIIPRPLRKKIIAWDQYHNINYPPAFIPKDDLITNSDNFLDSHGDHIHTNFKDAFIHLRNKGYFIEVINRPLIEIDWENYGTLMLVDMEELVHPMEKESIVDAFLKKNLNLLILGDWFNEEISAKLSFYDSNKGRDWIPEMAGANLPSYNYLLSHLGIQFGNKVLHGPINFQDFSFTYGTGCNLLSFPGNEILSRKGFGYLLNAQAGLTKVLPSSKIGPKKKKKYFERKPLSFNESLSTYIGGLWVPDRKEVKTGSLFALGDSTFTEKITFSSISSTNRFIFLDTILLIFENPLSPMNNRFKSLFKKITGDQFRAENAYSQIPKFESYPNFGEFSKTLKRETDFSALDDSLRRSNFTFFEASCRELGKFNIKDRFKKVLLAPIHKYDLKLSSNEEVFNDDFSSELDRDPLPVDIFCHDPYNPATDKSSQSIYEKESILPTEQRVRLFLGFFFIWSALLVVVFRSKVNRFIAVLIYKLVSSCNRFFYSNQNIVSRQMNNNPVKLPSLNKISEII